MLAPHACCSTPTIAKTWKIPVPFTQWMRKLEQLLRKHEIMSSAAIWKELENIIVNEARWTQKDEQSKLSIIYEKQQAYRWTKWTVGTRMGRVRGKRDKKRLAGTSVLLKKLYSLTVSYLYVTHSVHVHSSTPSFLPPVLLLPPVKSLSHFRSLLFWFCICFVTHQV